MSTISIITINLNNRRALQKTFDSVFGQSTTDFEYIVIDGGSVDGSRDCIVENAWRINYWVSEEDNGIYDAMNKGIAVASNKHIIFLNSGDSFSELDTLEKCLEFIHASPAVDVFYADIYMVDDQTPPSKLIHQHPGEVSLSYFQKNCLNHQASIFTKDLFDEFGLYPDQYKLAADYWLYLKSFLCRKRYQHLDFVMVNFDNSGTSTTNWPTYEKEMNLVWTETVPKSIRQSVREKRSYKILAKRKVVDTAVRIRQNLVRIKSLLR